VIRCDGELGLATIASASACAACSAAMRDSSFCAMYRPMFVARIEDSVSSVIAIRNISATTSMAPLCLFPGVM
jgi:hypothetical protein